MNNSLNVSFGIKKKSSYGSINGRNIGKNIVDRVKKINPCCEDTIVGKAYFGDTVATITINPNNYIIEVEPKHLTEKVLKNLSKSFHKDNKARYKHNNHNYNFKNIKNFNKEI